MLRDAATGEDWPAVGQAINARMQERRITQQALAAASGVSVATLRELQRGTNRRRAHDTTLIAIARALGWPDDHLLAVLLGEPPRDVTAPPLPIDRQILEVLLRIERHVADLGAHLRVPTAGGDGGRDQPAGYAEGPDRTAG
ncbi:helix-turn-helix domain-containing protein [Frankia sp. AiPs1]|uniref:helix-turn-helix domain-containing protein n=1 Tax=Frankia sp. AiPs1 TaxID=573493 RepID=UPI002043E327|nr:helix-turn-helix transcriptional regulator [Frankia sp. AiPs1]MCM3921097.1 helix-turn-helix domain-containing protein [Frankia sp. AiPs1]